MHTYLYDKEDRLWTVGFFDPRGTPSMPDHAMWHPLSDHGSEEEAIERVNRLNGGNSRVTVEVLEA